MEFDNPFPFADDEPLTFKERITIPGYEYTVDEAIEILAAARAMGYNIVKSPGLWWMKVRDVDILVNRIQ